MAYPPGRHQHPSAGSAVSSGSFGTPLESTAASASRRIKTKAHASDAAQFVRSNCGNSRPEGDCLVGGPVQHGYRQGSRPFQTQLRPAE